MSVKCTLCGLETTGSTGAAGLRWPTICQRCKDKEDAALEERVAADRRAVYIFLRPQEVTP